MSKHHDQTPAGGNSRFGNLNGPEDVRGDEGIETSPVDDPKTKKPGRKSAKPIEQAAMVYGSIGSGDIHKAG